MASGGKTVRFALDHNFPAPVLGAFSVMMPNVELVAIATIDQGFAELDDWELFVALHRTSSPGTASSRTMTSCWR